MVENGRNFAKKILSKTTPAFPAPLVPKMMTS